MAYLVVDKKGNEFIFQKEPYYDSNYERWDKWYNDHFPFEDIFYVELPKGTIEKILGYKLTFEKSIIEICEDGTTQFIKPWIIPKNEQKPIIDDSDLPF